MVNELKKERGVFQDFLDEVKRAKQDGRQRVEFVYHFPNLFGGEIKACDKETTIDIEHEVVEPKLLKE